MTWYLEHVWPKHLTYISRYTHNLDMFEDMLTATACANLSLSLPELSRAVTESSWVVDRLDLCLALSLLPIDSAHRLALGLPYVPLQCCQPGGGWISGGLGTASSVSARHAPPDNVQKYTLKHAFSCHLEGTWIENQSQWKSDFYHFRWFSWDSWNTSGGGRRVGLA